MNSSECAFCAMVADPGAVVHQVFRDEVAMAFLDHRPLFPGHLLVIPIAHVPTLPELPAELVGPFFERVRQLTGAVERGTGARGSFVAMNNRISQSVPHLHVHVVPRNPKDGLRGFFWPRTRYPDQDAAQRVAAAIRAALDPAG
ncbi:HIT family protein [Kitasatospora acidiphila]|uniref:HIT family protein n=1 Tax=Kitasatospora acidiphila TaxID=2567942 RepID=A0A540VZX4_9ACTN|nr:HIT family protein [Kitasatospora acidiphila]TQF01654.1 HIT family protein [Kitasatospora acidiphila]